MAGQRAWRIDFDSDSAGLQLLLSRGFSLDEAVEAAAVDFIEVTLLYTGLLWSLCEAGKSGSVDLVEISFLGETTEARPVDLVEVALLCAEGHATETKGQ